MAYFRRLARSEQGWEGPAQVIGIDNNIIIVRHGQKVVHAHKRDVRKFLKDKGAETAWNGSEGENQNP